jgi:hypothetical protein
MDPKDVRLVVENYLDRHETDEATAAAWRLLDELDASAAAVVLAEAGLL